MLFPPPPPRPPEPRREQHERERAFHREALHDLVCFGINTAKALERRAMNASFDSTNAVIEAAATYERVARAIRRTILLAEKLAEPLPPEADTILPPQEQGRDPQPAPTPAREPRDPANPDSPHHEARADATAGQTRPEPGEDALDAPESCPESIEDDAPTAQPIPEQIAAIRRDLPPGEPLHLPLPTATPPLAYSDRYPQHTWVTAPPRKSEPTKHARKRTA